MPDQQIFASPFNAFLQGRQMRGQEQQQGFQNQLAQQQADMQQAEFAQQQEQQAQRQQYNQLLSQYVGPDAAQMAGGGGDPNAMQPQAQAPSRPSISQLYALDPQRTMQLQQFQAQQQAQQQAQEQEQAKQTVTRAQYALQSEHPATLLKVGFPEFADQLKKQGVEVDKLSDDDVRGYAQTLIEHYGPIAGIGPASAKPGEQFTLGEGQTRYDAQGRAIASVAAKPSDKDPTDKTFTRANVLRDEFTAGTKDYGTVKASYDAIKSTAESPSAAGDLSLLTGYMKMLDPGSTVREGEFANAQNAGSAFEKVGGIYNKLLTGERLTEAQRKDFVNQAKNLYTTRQTQYEKLKGKYTTLAKRASVDPIDVVGEDDVPAQPVGAAPAGPAVGTVQQGYRFKGGNPSDPASWERQ